MLIRSLELQKIYHSFYNSIDCKLDIGYSHLHYEESSYNQANHYEDLVQEGDRFYLAGIKINRGFIDFLNIAYVEDYRYGYPRPEPSPHLSPKLCLSYSRRFGDNSRAEHEWQNNTFYQQNQHFFSEITRLFQQLLPTFPEFQLKMPEFSYHYFYVVAFSYSTNSIIFKTFMLYSKCTVLQFDAKFLVPQYGIYQRF